MALSMPSPGERKVIGSSCCLDELRLLYSTVNATINPCNDIFAYVCDSYERNVTPGSVRDIRLREEPARYLPSNTAAGKLINKHFRVCLRAMSRAEELGPETVTSLADFMGRQAFRTERDMLRLVVEMTLKYSLETTVLFATTELRDIWKRHLPGERLGGRDTVVVIACSIQLKVKGPLAKLYARLRQEALDATNAALSTNVTQREIETLVQDLKDIPRKHVVSESPLSALTDMVPTVSTNEWQTLLESIMGSPYSDRMYHTLVKDLNHRLGILLDRARQPATVAFLLLDAACNLLWNVLNVNQKAAVQVRYFERCRRESQTLVPLLVFNRLQTIRSATERTEQFRAIFHRLVHLVAEAAARFSAPEDAESVKQFVRGIRMYLPRDIFDLEAPLPKLDSRYAWNFMSLQASRWTAQRVPLRKDVSRDAVKDSIETKHLVVRNASIYVSVSLFTALNISDDFDPVVAYATVGMSLADSLWRTVFAETWSQETNRLFNIVNDCRAASGKVSPRSVFRHSELSFNVTLEAARGKRWFDDFSVDGFLTASRSRVFFMLLLFHYYCPGRTYTYDKVRSESNYLYTNTEDYRKAFRCPRKDARDDTIEACVADRINETRHSKLYPTSETTDLVRLISDAGLYAANFG
ncbi:hypothetical protein V5799_029063 [Amblyomma americanum]|uniref:Uncharacterized protein n=1 Tax=Amblyomma americanum TaxID=6943 RepID=A0AAQ4ESA3_AMBAM